MVALELSDIRDFMNRLLRTELFDHFLLQEAAITGACGFVIDGRLNRNFYSEEELQELGLTECEALPFGMLREQCFALIRGKYTPSTFQFIFRLSPENLARTLESCHSSFTVNDITGIFMNIRYRDRKLLLTTGVSYRIFSPDKSLEQEWDRLVMLFLKQNSIPFEKL